MQGQEVCEGERLQVVHAEELVIALGHFLVCLKQVPRQVVHLLAGELTAGLRRLSLFELVTFEAGEYLCEVVLMEDRQCGEVTEATGLDEPFAVLLGAHAHHRLLEEISATPI